MINKLIAAAERLDYPERMLKESRSEDDLLFWGWAVQQDLVRLAPNTPASSYLARSAALHKRDAELLSKDYQRDGGRSMSYEHFKLEASRWARAQSEGLGLEDDGAKDKLVMAVRYFMRWRRNGNPLGC